jgi:hypothetical protein
MPDTRGVQLAAAAVTPGRRTHVKFDISDPILSEPFFLHRREGRQFAPSSVTDCIRLKSGIWTIRPSNRWANLHETTTGQSGTIRLASWHTVSQLVEVPHQRVYSELTGIGNDASVSSSGDYFLTKRITAGTTWANLLSTGGTLPSIGTTAYPMDCVAVAKDLHPANQGLYLRILLPGAEQQTPDFIAGLRFGGELTSGGYGLFFLVLAGDGRALLYEWISGAWSQVADWQYASPRDGSASSISMRIIPHAPHFIEFASHSLAGDSFIERLAEIAHDAALIGSGDMTPIGTYLHETTNRGDVAISGGGPGFLRPVTGQGYPSLWIRRDIRPLVQVSRIFYPATSQIVDRPLIGPLNVSNSHVLRLNLIGYNFYPGDGAAVTSMSGVLQNADGSSLTANTESYTFNGTTYSYSGWNPNSSPHHLRAVLTLGTSEGAGVRWHAPHLLGYEVIRNGHLGTNALGQVEHDGCVGLTVTGPSYSIDHETASLQIQDPADSLSWLRARGRSAIRIETEYDAADTTKRATIFRGVVGRATASLRGKRGKTWPSANWRELRVECAGMWDRLARKAIHGRYNFADDSNSPSGRTGQKPDAWFVTDIIRFLLQNEGGYPTSMLDIPHNGQRVFLNQASPDSGLFLPNPGGYVMPYIEGLARDFLNAYLIFDDNAGSDGMWRLRQAPSLTTAAVWAFVTTAPTGTKLAYRSAAYGTGISPILGPDWKTPFQVYTVPPQCTRLTVYGRKRSFGVFSTGVEQLQRTRTNPNNADSASLDFSPNVDELIWTDFGLDTQFAVDFLADRLASHLLKAHRYARFTAEYVLLPAATLEPAIYTNPNRPKRPLLPGDVVTVDGEKWAVDSIAPSWSHDSMQLMYGELRYLRDYDPIA